MAHGNHPHTGVDAHGASPTIAENKLGWLPSTVEKYLLRVLPADPQILLQRACGIGTVFVRQFHGNESLVADSLKKSCYRAVIHVTVAQALAPHAVDGVTTMQARDPMAGFTQQVHRVLLATIHPMHVRA